MIVNKEIICSVLVIKYQYDCSSCEHNEDDHAEEKTGDPLLALAYDWGALVADYARLRYVHIVLTIVFTAEMPIAATCTTYQ